MDNYFNNSFMGYLAKDVTKKINAIRKNHEEELDSYNLQLMRLKEENQKLAEQIEAHNSLMKNYKGLMNKLQDAICSTYIEEMSKIYEADKMLKQMKSYKIDILETQENKNRKIEKYIVKLLEEINTVVVEE